MQGTPPGPWTERAAAWWSARGARFAGAAAWLRARGPRLEAATTWLRARRDRVLAAAIASVTLLAFAILQVTGGATANYDARSHLVVARRIFDSATPGWLQHGVLWLPLPHVLALPLVWPDALYRSGLGVSLLSLVAALGATFHVWRLARRLFADADLPVVTATVVFGLNPNAIYAAATPLTEPLLLYLLAAAADTLARWYAVGTRRTLLLAGVYLALGCATRYEAWPFVAAAALVVVLRGGLRPAALAAGLRDATLLGAIGSAGAIVVLLHTWYVAGDPLAFRELAGGENPSRGIWQLALRDWGLGVVYLTGLPLALLFFLSVVDAARARGPRLSLAVVFALLVPALVPAVFYPSGHLFRYRYALTALPAVALFCAWASIRNSRLALGVLALQALLLVQPAWPPYRSSLWLESVWHLHAEPERAVGARFLRYAHDGRPVLAAMRSLAPFLWETGLPLRLVVHEGNGHLRNDALERPREFVGWIVLEAGDEFSAYAAAHPGFFDGFERVFAEGTLEIWRATARATGR